METFFTLGVLIKWYELKPSRVRLQRQQIQSRGMVTARISEEEKRELQLPVQHGHSYGDHIKPTKNSQI